MIVKRSGTRKYKRGDYKFLTIVRNYNIINRTLADPILMTIYTILEIPIPVDIRQLDGNWIRADMYL